MLGFGKLGQYLVKALGALDKCDIEVAVVYNRSPISDEANEILEASCGKDVAIIHDLELVFDFPVDLIVEVAHPSVTAKYGVRFLAHAHYFCGSPTAFADATVESSVLDAARRGPNGLYVPSGALWGAQDVQKMAERGLLDSCTIAMKKHPSAFKLVGPLKDALKDLIDRNVQGESTLYAGSVRGLCPMAPNNVNTMACLALASYPQLNFDRVNAVLVSDPSLDAHVIEMEVCGPVRSDGQKFYVKSTRYNPAAIGAVTGSATFASFLSSLLRARGHEGSGVHFC